MIFSQLLTIFSIVLILILAKWLWSRRKLYSLSSKLAGPRGLPVFGSALNFLCKKEDVLRIYLDLTSPYPSPSKLWMGPKLAIIVKDPSQLQTILQSSKVTTKAEFYRFLDIFLGQGLVTSTDPVHKQHRKLFEPFFTQKIVEGYTHLFQKHANLFVEKIRKYVDGEEFNLMPVLHGTIFQSTMDVLIEDKNQHSVDYNDVPVLTNKFYEIVFRRFRTFWLHSDFIYRKTSDYKELMGMRNLADTVIEEIINSTLKKVVQRLNSDDQTETRTPSVLEMLAEIVIENPKYLSIQQCSDHLTTLVGASLDTTSGVIAFTCMMFGAYPHTQELAIKEIREVLKGKTSFDLADVSELRYLEMCIKESLRLFTIVPVTFRQTTEEFIWGKLTIPKDVIIGISIYHAHKDPKQWERPDEFYPDHFLPEAVRKRHPYAFIPFSAGPRKCLAQFYSYTKLKIFVATILLNYEIECRHRVEDIKLTTDISLRPISGHLVKIKKRIS